MGTLTVPWLPVVLNVHLKRQKTLEKDEMLKSMLHFGHWRNFGACTLYSCVVFLKYETLMHVCCNGSAAGKTKLEKRIGKYESCQL